MELTGPALDAGERYKKIVADTARLDALLVDLFLDWHGEQPERIVLDVDATDDPLHGRQEGRFFHGYYRSYCYLPLYIFCGQQLLGARLRTADRDAADGTVEELERIVGRIRVSVRGPCGCRSTRASLKRASSGRCWPVSRACPCAVSSCTPAIVSSPVGGRRRRGSVRLQGGLQAKTSPNNRGSGDPYQASARIRHPTQHCQAIHPPQMDKTPPNLRLLRRSG